MNANKRNSFNRFVIWLIFPLLLTCSEGDQCSDESLEFIPHNLTDQEELSVYLKRVDIYNHGLSSPIFIIEVHNSFKEDIVIPQYCSDFFLNYSQKRLPLILEKEDLGRIEKLSKQFYRLKFKHNYLTEYLDSLKGILQVSEEYELSVICDSTSKVDAIPKAPDFLLCTYEY